jgi:transcriptional antiterminator
MTDNKAIKQDLLRLFEEGKSETEAFNEISKKQSSSSISLKTVSNWYRKFGSGERNIDDKKTNSKKFKFTDEFLIDLVNNNPKLNMRELAELAGVSQSTICRRLKKINIDGSDSIYVTKGYRNGVTKFSDELLINLVNDNPKMSMIELAKHTGTTYKTISNRLKQINSNEKRVNYVKKEFKLDRIKITDEYLISLVKDHPELNMRGLAKLADVSPSTISKRVGRINSEGSNGDIVIQEKHLSKLKRKSRKNITAEYLIKLTNENPNLNTYELADLADVSQSKIWNMLKSINTDGQKVNYTKKGNKGGVTKFTDEFIINLVNENPDLNTTQLAKLCNTTRITLSNRLKKMNIDGKDVNYIKKDFKRGTKFTDEFLINLINENPKLNVSELAKLSNVSSTTIYKRLKKINVTEKE